MNYPAHLDLRCYVVTGSGTDDDIVATAARAAAGGAGVIQVRSKPITAARLLGLAEKVALAVAEVNPDAKTLIDDRVDIAAILMRRGIPIHGVHVGQEDIPVAAVRELLGPDNRRRSEQLAHRVNWDIFLADVHAVNGNPAAH